MDIVQRFRGDPVGRIVSLEQWVLPPPPPTRFYGSVPLFVCRQTAHASNVMSRSKEQETLGKEHQLTLLYDARRCNRDEPFLYTYSLAICSFLLFLCLHLTHSARAALPSFCRTTSVTLDALSGMILTITIFEPRQQCANGRTVVGEEFASK